MFFLIEFKTFFIAFLRIIGLQLLHYLLLLQQTNEFFIKHHVYIIELFNIIQETEQPKSLRRRS